MSMSALVLQPDDDAQLLLELPELFVAAFPVQDFGSHHGKRIDGLPTHGPLGLKDRPFELPFSLSNIQAGHYGSLLAGSPEFGERKRSVLNSGAK